MRRTRRRAIPLASSIAVALVVAFIVSPATSIAARSGAKARPVAQSWVGVDARTTGAAVGVGARVADARATLARSLGRLGVIQSDRTTGTIRFVGKLNGYLTRPSASSASSVALGYVRSNLTAFNLSASDLGTLRLVRDYVDVLGTHHLYWTQQAGGLTLFGQGLMASVSKSGRLINVAGGPMRGLRAPAGGFRMTPDSAVAAARSSAGSRVTSRQKGDTVSRVLFPGGRGAIAAWQTMTRISSDETDVSVVADATGRVVYRNNITNSDQGVGKAWPFYPSDLVQNDGDVPRTVSFPVYDGSALNGNNAHVYTDVDDDNQPDPGDDIPAKHGTSWLGYSAPLNWNDPSQNCSTHRACTWSYNEAFSWQDDLAHNAVQVYSFINQYHHHLKNKPIGFTEAAGNFQQHNSTGHGLGGDPVQGQASDGANSNGAGHPDLNHINNANMSTPPDGLAPTMQMYLFQRTGGLPTLPSANGGNDAEVVYHEYTHGLSNRLVTYPGGGSGLDNQQAGSMGEAWSDWYAEDYLNDQGYKLDKPGNGNFRMGIGTFAGILRSQPVDCPVNAKAKVCPGAGTAGPGGYTYGDFGKIRGRPEVHSDGEIWLETLWDLRNALGSRATEQIVSRGMELSPPSPSYLDMRNAIIQADVVANDGVNSRTIWAVFANRGMGYFASTFGGGDVTPVEDFSTPPVCGRCFTISGTVKDKATGDPAAGVRVGVAGLDSGFEGDLSDKTNADGEYRIRNVPPHTYAAVEFGGGGYEPTQVLDVEVKHDITLNNKVYRDWAALSGGATLKSFTPPDYAVFCGQAAEGAFDLNLGSGWPSDSPNNGDSGVTGPRQATVLLPDTVDITEFTVTSGGTCGDGPDSGVTDFKFMTKTAGGKWKLAVQDTAVPDGVLRAYAPTGNADNVVAIRFVMLKSNGNQQFMDVLEAGVRGGAS